jgi:outer membrane protein with beta-barrel domain
VRVARTIATAAVLLLALGPARRAEAFERQQHLGIDGGYSLLKIDGKSTVDSGGGFGVHYAYGISDAFNLSVELQHSIVALNQRLDSPSTPHTFPAYASSATVGAQYVFDVLTWVPYAGLLAGPYLMGGGTIDSPKVLFGAQLELGIDYQLSRSFAVGVAYHEHFVLSDMSTYPVFFNVFARVEYVWGW